MHFLAEAIRRRTLGPNVKMANPPDRKISLQIKEKMGKFCKWPDLQKMPKITGTGLNACLLAHTTAINIPIC